LDPLSSVTVSTSFYAVAPAVHIKVKILLM